MPTEPSSKLDLRQLKPYWMGTGGEAVANDVELCDELIVLSGPNMGGKSTFLRSLIAAVLLGNCGLPIPARPGSNIPEVCALPPDLGMLVCCCVSC
jgi:dsDNA-specific endonuclease/ATPase MutS2